MKASVAMDSSASHIANKSLVAFESPEMVEYMALQPFTKRVPFQSALQGYAPFSLSST